MNRKEVIQVMLLLSGNYEGIATKMETQKEIMVDTWGACLSDLDYEIVIKAIKVHIMKSPYPPTIYDIRKNATEILNPSTQRTAIEAWNEAYAMICRGGYMTEEEFEKASPEVKSFFGSVRQVKELALTHTDIVNSVTKGQFLKQYEVLIKRENEQKLLPMNELVKEISEKMEEEK